MLTISFDGIALDNYKETKAQACMALAKELTRNNLINDSKFRASERGTMPENIASQLAYSVDVVISDRSAFGIDRVAGIVLTRHWNGDPLSIPTLSWTFEGISTKLTEDDFDNHNELLFDDVGRDYGHVISLLSILSLKVKYDFLRGDKSDGLLSNSEIGALRKIGFWSNYSCELNKIVSGLICSSKGRVRRRGKKDCRKYKHTPLIDKFLFDANELYNLVCWTPETRQEKSTYKSGEKYWTINSEAKDIRVCLLIYENDDRRRFIAIPDDIAQELLKECFFPNQALRSRDKLSTQKSISTNVINQHEKRQVSELDKVQIANIKQNCLKYIDRLKPSLSIISGEPQKKPLRESYIGWDFIRKEFSQILDADPQDKDESGSKARLDPKVVAMRRSAEKKVYSGSFANFIRSYYSSDEKRKDNCWYHFSLGHDEMKTASFTKSEWLGCPIQISESSSSSELIDMPSPDVCIPKNTTFMLINDLTSCGARLWNGPTYRLCAFNPHKPTGTWLFSEIDFCRYRFTYGLLYDELLHTLWKCDFELDKVLANSNDLLPLRKSLMPNVHSISSFGDRICASAIEVLFAIARPAPSNEFTIVTNVRSNEVCEAQNMRHVIPAGFHEPSCSISMETNPFCTLFRELYEELFNGKEVEKSVKRMNWDFFFHFPGPMKWLYDHPNSWHLEFLGLSLSAITGVACIGYLLVIHDPLFCKKYWQVLEGRWETKTLDLISSKKEQEVIAQLKKTDWIPEGLIVFAEGLRRLKQLYPERCNYPDITRTSPS